VEIDTCLDLATDLKYVDLTELKELGDSIVKVFKMLTGMIG
jgi:hypothetical protein